MRDAPGIVCRECGHGNPEGSRFCGLCGEILVVETFCSGCGEMVPPGSRFCNQCGTPVGAPPQAPLAIPEDLAWKINAGRESMEAEGYFELTPLGEREVKGASTPLEVYRLERAGHARGRLDVSRSRGLSSFVCRAAEVAELEAAFERSLTGAGEVVGIVAAAGVGKSPLCHDFVHVIFMERIAVLRERLAARA